MNVDDVVTQPVKESGFPSVETSFLRVARNLQNVFDVITRVGVGPH